MAIEFARFFGFDVIAIDRGTAKGKLCLDQGASHFFDVALLSTEEVVTSILKMSFKEGHHGVEGVIVASGGSIGPFHMAFEILRPLGVIMILGNPNPENYMKLDVPKMLIKNIKIVSTLMGGRKDCEEALAYLAAGIIHPRLDIRSLVDINQILEEIESGQTLGKVVISIPQDQEPGICDKII